MFERAAPEESAPSSDVVVDADSGSDADSTATVDTEWRQIHHTLLRLADEAARLDWEIGVELLRAERARCHARLGFGSVIEYADRLFGYSPHTTEERLRVARSLEKLPLTTDALRGGTTSWSAVRELTRVATPQTEAEWLDAARDQRVREVQGLVRGRRPGESPNDPSTAEAERHAAESVPERVSKAGAATPRTATATATQDPPQTTPRRRATQSTATEDPSQTTPRRRATQSIPPATRRLVMRRHHGRCGVTGCRHASFVDVQGR